MTLNVTRIACAALFVVLGLQASGCSAIASEPMRAQGKADLSIRQFIVKFKPHTLPCTAAGIAHLSSAANARLEHVRAMSGDACVIRQIEKAADAAESEQRVRRHPAIEWMEPDAVMKAF